jgi:3-phosphoshikimate 1-carboxyvinyltransferase
MERVAGPLREMGAVVETNDGRPPIVVRGQSPLLAIEHQPERPSAQVKSAVLLAGLAAAGRTRVVEPVRTRDHTERMLRAFGARVDADERGDELEGPVSLVATHVEVPGDLSSAVFLLVAALVVPGSDLVVRDVGLNPTRVRVLEILADLGADLEIVRRDDANEPRGDVRARYTGALGTKGPLHLGAREIAEAIDEIPALAVLAARSAHGIRFDGAGELRAKESDRIGAIAEGLGRMGAEVATWEDGFEVRGGAHLRGARVRSWGDHRIAMALSCAALSADGETIVEGAEAASVSFPGFYDALPEGAVETTARDGE